MELGKTERGFDILRHPRYVDEPDTQPVRLAQQSSAVGQYEDAFDRPGSSFLWVGDDHHLNREEVSQFVQHLQAWLQTGCLRVAAPQPSTADMAAADSQESVGQGEVAGAAPPGTGTGA